MSAPARRRLLAAPLAAAALLGGCHHEVTGSPVAEPHPTPAAVSPTVVAPAPPPLSDEDQIRQAVQIYQDAYNTQNWDAYRQIMCPAMREQFTGPAMDMVRKLRAESGMSTATVTAVTITGDTASAAIDAQNELVGRVQIDLPLRRVDGWKICKVA